MCIRDSWGTVQELRVTEPEKKFEDTPIVGVYPVPSRYSFWIGDIQQNSTSMDYSLTASYLEKALGQIYQLKKIKSLLHH